ncbi:flagellar basal body-associated FliL family protein [Aurantivibrio infirmus]
MASKDKEKEKGEESENDQEAPAKGGSKKKLIIISIIAVVFLSSAIGGTIFALKSFSGAEDEMADSALVDPEEEKDKPKSPAIYFPIKPAIVVSFQARGKQRFLQAEITLLIRDESVVDAIESHMPMVRNALVMLLGGQVYEELQTAEGKEMVRQLAADELGRIMEAETGTSGIEQVLFTHFVME